MSNLPLAITADVDPEMSNTPTISPRSVDSSGSNTFRKPEYYGRAHYSSRSWDRKPWAYSSRYSEGLSESSSSRYNSPRNAEYNYFGKPPFEGPDAIYIGHLNKSMTDAELRETFEVFGQIVDLFRKPSSYETNHEGSDYAFIRYAHPDYAAAAIATLDATIVKNKKIIVKSRVYSGRKHKSSYFPYQQSSWSSRRHNYSQADQNLHQQPPLVLSAADNANLARQFQRSQLISISNLSFDMTAEELYDLISDIGSPHSVVIHDKPDDNGQRSADVIMSNHNAALTVISALDNEEVMGQKIRVVLKTSHHQQSYGIPCVYWTQDAEGYPQAILYPQEYLPQNFSFFNSYQPSYQYGSSFESLSGPQSQRNDTFSPSSQIPFSMNGQSNILAPPFGMPLPYPHITSNTDYIEYEESRSDTDELSDMLKVQNHQIISGHALVMPLASRRESEGRRSSASTYEINDTPQNELVSDENKQTGKRSRSESEAYRRSNRRNLFVRNLDPQMIRNSNDLKDLFSAFGEIESTKLVLHPGSGFSRGYGFVQFAQSADAVAAILSMDGLEIGRFKIYVAVAEGQVHRTTVSEPYSREDIERGDKSNHFNKSSTTKSVQEIEPNVASTKKIEDLPAISKNGQEQRTFDLKLADENFDLAKLTAGLMINTENEDHSSDFKPNSVNLKDIDDISADSREGSTGPSGYQGRKYYRSGRGAFNKRGRYFNRSNVSYGNGYHSRNINRPQAELSTGPSTATAPPPATIPMPSTVRLSDMK
ncbi:uncharacterized protein V1516DRAFT_181604 [Lipomyces oligophaga]|uniref:uncharacterized protein n=1 Tax=Lipomyces oligophaga TaxID=45792 RepID=UPI0034CF42F4